MTSSSRGLLIPVVLVALAILLPDAAVAGCCQCSFDGTNCSACCYIDQTPSCAVENAGSVYYCACTCLGGAGTGGGGGEVGCSVRLDSRTTVMSSERGTEREPKLSPHQLGGGLLNSGTRRDGTYNFEEWALVSSTGDVLRASTTDFAERVQAEGQRFRPQGKGRTSVLVIEDAEQPQNSREIPTPAVAPIDIDAELSVTLAGQEIWFRAEFGKDGELDQVIFINLPEELAWNRSNERLHKRMREQLSLRYADERRHRAVVFGLLRANVSGHLVMTRSRVILPKCCCNGRHCV